MIREYVDARDKVMVQDAVLPGAILAPTLIVPAAFHWQPALTVVAATVLAIESIVFVWVHAKYGEIASIIVSSVLGLLMAFIAYGRMVLKLIS